MFVCKKEKESVGANCFGTTNISHGGKSVVVNRKHMHALTLNYLPIQVV